MELSFIARAVRRYWYLVVAVTALGVAGAVVFVEDEPAVYETDALLSILPPESNGGGAELDRYIASQLVVLGSESVSEAAAERADLGLDAVLIRRLVDFEQIDETNIVRVEAQAASPAAAVDVADAYIDSYFEQLREQRTTATSDTRARLDESIAALERELDDIDLQVQAALSNFLPAIGSLNEVPTIEQVDPQLATARQTLIDQYGQLLSARTDLDVGRENRINSQIVQRPVARDEPTTAATSPLVLIGPLFGLLCGALLAAYAARRSRHVLDRVEAVEILGTPLVGTVPRMPTSRGLHRLAVETAADTPALVDELGVLAHARSRPGESFTLVVAGTRSGIGTTTTAVSMAAGLAARGSSVLLVDADANRPQISHEFEGADRPARSDLDLALEHGESTVLDFDDFAPTEVDGLRVATFARDVDPMRQLHRTFGLATSRHHGADVVVIDVGPVLATAASVRISRLPGPVVLLVPRRQQAGQLERIARQLGTDDGDVFPVATTHSVSRLRERLSAPSGATFSDTDLVSV